MNEKTKVIERLLRYALHINFNTEFSVDLSISKTHIFIYLFEDTKELIKEQIDNFNIINIELFIDKTDIIFRKLNRYK